MKLSLICTRAIAILSTGITLTINTPTAKGGAALAPFAPFCSGPQLPACVVLGIVMIGGIKYYQTYNKENQVNYLLRINGKKVTSLNRIIKSGSGGHNYKIVNASSAIKAKRECDKIKPPGTIVQVTKIRKGKYQCDFIDVSQELDIDALLD